MPVIVDHVPRTPEDAWHVARWAFVWLLRQAMVECGDDSATRLLFERGIALDGLHLHLLSADEAGRARRILQSIAARGARGQLPRVEVDGRVLDERSQRQFRDAVKELEELLNASTSR
jgi:hypothetical protein